MNSVHLLAPLGPGDAADRWTDALQTGVVRIDGDGATLSANAAAVRLLGAAALARPFLHPLPLSELLRGRDVAEGRFEMDGRPLGYRAAVSGQGWLIELTDLRAFGDGALCDPLTGLADRRALRERIGAQLAAQRRGGPAFAVLCLDLDRFKAVNDTLGHPVGDALLRKVGERLRNAAREEDLEHFPFNPARSLRR